MTKSELIEIVRRELMSLADKFVSNNFTDAADEASRETGWAFPVSGDFKIVWIKKRTKRHLFYMLQAGAAKGFKIDQINLQQEFEHYEKLIKNADKEFEDIQASEPFEFANVAACQTFGHLVDAGFSSDGAGQDTTYQTDNLVIVTPSSTED